MKILHTVERYHPHIGGAERVVRRISEELVRRGHEVTVATGKAGPLPARETINGVQVIRFDIEGNQVRGCRGQVEEYRRFLLGHPRDVMLNYAAQCWPTDVALNMLEVLPAMKVLAPCGYSYLRHPLYAHYFHTLATLGKGYDAYIYHGSHYQDRTWGAEHGFMPEVVIPNGADTEEFATPTTGFRRGYGLEDCKLVVAVSNHHQVKGHGLLMDAFRRLERRDVALALIGRKVSLSPRRSCWLKCRASGSLNNSIAVLEEVPRRLVVAAYFEADVVALTSRIECAPLTIVESMAAGRAFVSTPVGNVGEYLDCGVVAEPDSSNFANALTSILDDGARSSTLGEQGRRKWREDLTWESLASRYEALYMSLVSA